MDSQEAGPALANVLYAIKGSIAYVTVNRPKVLNALNTPTWSDLRKAFEDARNDEAIRGVILTGAGDKAFIAGADISELAHLSGFEAEQSSRFGQEVLDLIEKFGQPEVALGLVPGGGGTQRLPRLVGKGRALQLILGGEMITAQEAYRLGLVNEVVAPADLIPRAEAIVKKIASNAPIAIKLALEAVNKGLEAGQSDGLLLEASYFGLCAATEDKKEGTTAFLEKRAPRFQGR